MYKIGGIMKRRALAGVSVLLMGVTLVGCSGSSIKSVDDLRSAYVGEGYECSNPTFEQDDTYEMFGCENQAMLTYTKNKNGQKRHERTSEIMGGVSTLYVQSDANWHISSFDRSLLAPDLGGDIKTYGN